MTDLTVRGEAVVDIEIEAGIDTLKVQINELIAEGFLRYMNIAYVKSAGNVIGNERRIGGNRSLLCR